VENVLKSKNYIYIVLSVCLVAISIWYVRKNIFYKQIEPNIMVILNQKLQNNYLDNEIKKSILSEHYNEADEYYEFAQDYNYTLSKHTIQMIAEHNSTTERALRDTTSFANGFIFGESDSNAALAGSFASDMTIIGDIRDISKEGIKLSKGEKYDKFILALGVLGVGMSASQLVTAGISTPAKIGTSILKIAKKSGRLTKNFIKVLKISLSKIIDFKKLKSINWKNPKQTYTMLKKFTKTINTKSIDPIFNSFSKIRKNTSLVDSVELLKYVDDTKDLKKIAKISNKFKKNTKVVLKIIGKGALRGVKNILKWTNKLIFSLISLLISSVLFLVILWFVFHLFKKRSIIDK